MHQETEIQRLSHMAKFAKLISGGVTIWTQACLTPGFGGRMGPEFSDS